MNALLIVDGELDVDLLLAADAALANVVIVERADGVQECLPLLG